MTIISSARWLPSPNYTPGRDAKLTDIVLHWAVTDLAGMDSEFRAGSRKVSAHYGVEGATVHRYVKDVDTAWHAGDRAENHRSIGIEHSAAPGRPASALTIATSVGLIVELCRAHPTLSPDRIYPHKKFFPTQCPGTIPVEAIKTAVRAQLTTSPATPPEVDMPITQADADLISTTLLLRKLGSSGPNVAVALQRASSIDVAAIAAAVVQALPAVGGAPITQAQLEAALRTVLGSVDGT